MWRICGGLALQRLCRQSGFMNVPNVTPFKQSRAVAGPVAFQRAELGLRPGGFGLLLARKIADEMIYNEQGNEVLLIKHIV